MNHIINNQLACELPIEQSAIIKKTDGGIIADIPDQQYFSINALSKSHIEPALTSGVDYKFYSIDKLAPKCENAGIDDGSLLHCLTIERSEFEMRYSVEEDVDKIYSEYELYFRTHEEVKAFASKHNKVTTDNIKQIKDIAQEHNESELKSLPERVPYEALPLEFKSTELSKQGLNKALNTFKQKYYQRVTSLDDLKERLAFTIKHQLELGKELQVFFEKHKGDESLLEKMNEKVLELEITFNALEDDRQVAFINDGHLAQFVNKATQKKCEDKYIESRKSEASIINAKQAIIDLVQEMEALGIELKVEMDHLQKITTYGSKMPSGEQATIHDVLASIENVYGKKPILKSDEHAKAVIQADKEDKILVSKDKLEHGKRIVNAIGDHDEANKLLTNEHNLYEQAIFWNDPTTGKLKKGKVDVLNLELGYMADLKFVRSAEFDELERDSAKYNYHLQDSFYTEGVEAILKDDEPFSFFFIVVEKDAPELGKEVKKPIRIRVIEYKQVHKSRAKKLVDGAIFRIMKWAETDVYQGFEGVDEVDVPAYQVRKEERLLEQIKEEQEQWAAEKQAHGTTNSPAHDSNKQDDVVVDEGPQDEPINLPSFDSI